MNKSTTILILFLILASCKKEIKPKNSVIELKGKSFNLIAKSELDTMIFDFNDSTYSVYEYSDRNLPYRIANFNESHFLVLDSRIIALKKINKDNYKGLFIGEKDTEIDLIKRELKWKKNLLYGSWVEEKYVGTDSANFPPPPIEKVKSNWPPIYIISENKIVFDFYKKSESEININHSAEFITLNLNDPVEYGKIEKLWQIKFLSDSLMIVNKFIEERNHNQKFQSTREIEYGGIRLIKQR